MDILPTDCVNEYELFKIIYATLKDFLVFLKGYVEIEVVAFTFGMSHFAENTSVGTCNALYRTY